MTENNKLVQQFIAEGPVRKLLYYDDKDILITITTNMMLTQHSVSEEGDTREILKVFALPMLHIAVDVVCLHKGTSVCCGLAN